MSANDELQAHTCEKMLEFYGNVANNVAQGNSQDLTEQWKKGKLERGKKYWCKLTDETTEICYLWLQTNRFTTLTGYQSKCLPDEYVSEVLAPILSFEEWKDLKLHDEKATIKLGEKIIENAKLKELLKGCRGCVEIALENARIQESYTSTEYYKNLLTKIDKEIKNE